MRQLPPKRSDCMSDSDGTLHITMSLLVRRYDWYQSQQPDSAGVHCKTHDSTLVTSNFFLSCHMMMTGMQGVEGHARQLPAITVVG